MLVMWCLLLLGKLEQIAVTRVWKQIYVDMAKEKLKAHENRKCYSRDIYQTTDTDPQ